MIPVAEIFGPTIQGEGPNTGKKSLFVRVVGCDFNCEWCDSKFAWERNENTVDYAPYSLAQELVRRYFSTHTSQVIITGGNPCLYDFTECIQMLHNAGMKVDIETQGSRFPDWVSLVDLLVISPKAPSSKQPDVKDKVEEYIKKHQNQNIAIKIPVFNDEDAAFAEQYYDLITDYPNVKFYINVGNDNTSEQGDISHRILSNYSKLITKICESNMSNVYVMPQIHTLVWGNKQGV